MTSSQHGWRNKRLCVLPSVSVALAEAVPRVNAPDGNVHSCDISFRTVITSGIEGETGQKARAGSGDFSSRCDIFFLGTGTYTPCPCLLS